MGGVVSSGLCTEVTAKWLYFGACCTSAPWEAKSEVGSHAESVSGSALGRGEEAELPGTP